MTTYGTAWKVRIDYEARGEAVDKKAKLALRRGARSAIRSAGYRFDFICANRDDALEAAQEITDETGVPMSVSEVVINLWPA